MLSIWHRGFRGRKMNKIVHIINGLEIGGVEVGVLSLLASCHSNNYQVVVVGNVDQDLYNSLDKNVQSKLILCSSYFSAFQAALSVKPQIIVSSLWRAHIVSLLCRISGYSFRRVHFVHNNHFGHFINKVVTKLSLALSDLILCDSEETKAWIQKNSSLKQVDLKVVPMNVSFFSKDRTKDEIKPTFVFVGRYTKQKQIKDSLIFISHLKKMGIDASFDLFGRDDGDLVELKKITEELKLTEYVHFHGVLSPFEVEKQLEKYSFYLSTSINEGMAISVFQALRNGLIPIVRPVGEINNYTLDGINSVHVSDNMNDTAHRVYQLIKTNEVYNIKRNYIVDYNNYPVFSETFFSSLND